MTRTGVMILVVLVMLPGTALAQGLLDSIFGSGGLGLWGNQPGNQFDSPQYYGGPPAQAQQGLPPGYGYGNQPQAVPQAQSYAQPQQPSQAQSYAQPQQPSQAQGYAYPQQGYAQQGYPQGQTTYPQGYGAQGYSWQGSTQQGVYSDWQGYRQPVPAAPQAQYAQPQRQYAAPQAQAPAARQARPSVGHRGAAPPQQTQAAFGQRPGFDEDLPPGAVKITTSTPEGTTVRYYGPPGEQVQPQGTVAPSQPRARSTAARKPRSGKPSAVRAGKRAPRQKSMSRVAMPKPVQIPQGRDPRAGWAVAVDRAPTAPEVASNERVPRRQTGR